MVAVAVLVFALAWAVATALVVLASFGAAPLWLLLGGPLVAATWLTVAAARVGVRERVRSARSERIWARVHSIGSSSVDTLFFFASFAATSLLLVHALPLGNAAEAVVVAALIASLVAAVAVARAIRLPSAEGV